MFRQLFLCLYYNIMDCVRCEQCGQDAPHTYDFGRQSVYECQCGHKNVVKTLD